MTIKFEILKIVTCLTKSSNRPNGNPIREYIASREKELFEAAANLLDRCLYEPFKGCHWVVACPGVATLLLLGGPFGTARILSPKSAFDF